MNHQMQQLQTIDVIEHVWIPMPDGVQLAARLWLPADSARQPVPSVFEYIPYRKVDMVRARDERNHPYLAENGIAALRVDMRGSGDSEGLMPDMYTQHELDDARHVIDWIARQPWCNGRVGMFGTSWGGTASLQANIDAPGALKAVVAVCATHNRYEDDIHHMGGCLITDSIEWGTTLPTILGAPPSTNVGDGWKDMWRERLDNLAFPLEHWIREETCGTYWRHGSVIHTPERLTAPMLCIGGWADRYSNSVMSLVDLRPDLVWGVLGPWGHHYPDQGHPGPGIGFQDLMLEWWRHWLIPETPEDLDWPRMRCWLREAETPADAIDQRKGHWLQGAAPKSCTTNEVWHLTDTGLDRAAAGINLEVPAALSVGAAGADTGYFGRFGGLPGDQSQDDDDSLCFDMPECEQDRLLYGAAVIDLMVLSPTTVRQLCLRLNDVAPDGTSMRITWAARNLALDEQLDATRIENPGTPRKVRVTFPTAAYRLRAGHKLRLALSQSYWPMIWTPPATGDVTLLAGVLTLPTLQHDPAPLTRPLPAAKNLPLDPHFKVTEHAKLQRFPSETTDGMTHSGWHQPYTEVRYAQTDTRFGYETLARFEHTDNSVLSVRCRFDHRLVFTRPDGVAEVCCTVSVYADADAYQVKGSFTATWDAEPVGAKTWDLCIDRTAS